MSDNRETLTKRELIGYGAGDFASNLYFSFFGLFLLVYYTDVVGLDPAWVATLFLVARIFDAVTDPTMGMIADRTRTRWGRYRPYLLWIAIPFALTGPLLFMVPDASPTVQIIYAFVTYTLVMLFYTAINVPYSALMAVISPRADQRARASNFRFIGASGAVLLLSAATRPLVEWTGQGDEARGFVLTVSIYASLAFLLFLFCFAVTRERIETEPQPLAVRKDIVNLFSLKPWRFLAFGAILLIVSIAARASMVVHFFKYVAFDAETGIAMFDDPTTIFLTGMGIALFFGSLIGGRVIALTGKQPAMVWTAAIQGVSMILFWLMPPDQFWPLLIIQSIFSIGFGIQLVAIFAMFTDCAEYADYKTGRQMTALVMAASQFAMKLGGSLGAAIPAYLMASTGFVANTRLDELGVLGVRLGFIAVPTLCCLGVLLLFLKYPLRRAEVAEIEAELARRRAA